MKDSSILLRVGVNEIGRRSLVMSVGGCTFGIGTTFACFQRLGTSPSRIHALKIAHTGSASQTENSFRNQFGISSGPLDL